MFTYLKRKLIQRRLKATMRPDAAYARHRAAQLSGDRRDRFLRNIEGLV